MPLTEQTRAYRILRSVTALILAEPRPNDGKISITDFQELFLRDAFENPPKSINEMEQINKGTKILTTNEAEILVTHLLTALESRSYLSIESNFSRTDRNKPIENFDAKKEILDSVLAYFYEVHNITPERIQELLESRRRQIPITEDNRYQVILGDEVTEKDIDDAIELDFDGYEGEKTNIGIKETCYNWYRRNPFIYFMIKDIQTKKIVGYINAMPVTDELYEALKQDELDDINIPHKSILRYTASGQYNLYFASIVVKPSLKNHSKLARKLVDAVCDFFIEKANDNIIIKRMLAKEVSTDGKMLCLNMGMKSQNNDSIFEVSMYPPEFNGRKDAYRKIFDCYQNYYEEHKND